MRQAERAPDFTLPDAEGTPRRLSEFLDSKAVVLFFYPAALTPGCTAEACRFRDLAAEFGELAAQPVGISADSPDTQQRFADRYGFGFPLLSDADGTVSAQFGVRRGFGPLRTKRHTFVIDTDRRVLAVVRSEFRMSVHADKALEVLRSHQRG